DYYCMIWLNNGWLF
nr:immunoglobulin light chain junction region [Macaca mulatta]MOY06017.1 immunoglobulin light chain junction region [Macaca mulatta]